MLSFFKSIRARLTLWYSLVVLATLVAFGLIAYTYSSRQLLENLDQSLSSEVQWVNKYLAPKGGKVKPSKKFTSKKKDASQPQSFPQLELQPAEFGDADDDFWTQIYAHALVNQRKTLVEVTDKRGTIIFRSMNNPEENLIIGEVPLNSVRVITMKADDGTDLRLAATTTENFNIYAAYPLADLRDMLDNLYAIFLILIPIAVGVSISGGWFLANKALRPVDLITKTARRITAENLHEQIPLHEINDELGRLILTLNGMISRLRESFDRIKQFTVNASHELRTPLTIMRGEVELALGSAKDPEEYRRVLVSNLEENLRLASIIDNLLILSRADLEEYDIPFETIDLRELVEELFEDSVIIALKKQIRIELVKSEDVVIKGDKTRLRQLFLNLIENAVKFTPGHGTVTISLERRHDVAIVSIRDSGIGISAEEQPKIFDRFYRVDKARSREIGGTGLGLSIVKWIAELHHGKIEVESKVNMGSTFTVKLPAYDELSPRLEVGAE